MNKVHFENNTIHYRVSGNGSPVIFLHGFLEDHTMWQAIHPSIEALGFKIILVDLPCHGESRYNADNCSMQTMAEGVYAICEELNLKNPYVFGHSMGGYVGLELLKLMPIQLTLVHSNFWEDPLIKKRDRDRLVEIVNENKMRLIREAIPNLFAVINRPNCIKDIANLIASATIIPKTEIIASTRGMRDRTYNGDLLNENFINIIHGSLDHIVKTEKLNLELSKLKKQPHIQVIENCGHMSIWENSAALIKCLKLVVIR